MLSHLSNRAGMSVFSYKAMLIGMFQKQYTTARLFVSFSPVASTNLCLFTTFSLSYRIIITAVFLSMKRISYVAGLKNNKIK